MRKVKATDVFEGPSGDEGDRFQHDRSETDLWKTTLLIKALMRHLVWCACGGGLEEVVVAVSVAIDSVKKGAGVHDQKP